MVLFFFELRRRLFVCASVSVGGWAGGRAGVFVCFVFGGGDHLVVTPWLIPR